MEEGAKTLFNHTADYKNTEEEYSFTKNSP
jgi:hypothetical protein